MGSPKKPNKKLQHERELRGWSQQNVAEAIGTDFKRISAWENGTNQPSPYYRAKLCEIFGKNAQELGFLDQTADENCSPKNIIEFDAAASLSDLRDTTNQQNLTTIQPSLSSIHIYIPDSAVITTSTGLFYPESGTIVHIDGQHQNKAYSQHESVTQSITKAGNKAVKRREFLQEAGRATIASTALLTPYNTFATELLDRFHRALKRPATIDERMLTYLEKRTGGYWQDRHTAALSSNDLLGFALEHFQKITGLLENPLLPTTRDHLCSIASEVAQLAGHLLFDMGNYPEARRFHQAAIIAAQESRNTALEATAWARMSFTWTYSNNAPEALRCIQRARQLAIGNTNSTVQAYLAAVEAEIHAILGNHAACLNALDKAEHGIDQHHSQEDSYWLRFDNSRLAGYKGICFRRLYRPGDAQTGAFLMKSQQALTEALAQLDPARIQRQPTLLIDLADTFAVQGDINAVCEYISQAIPLIERIKSQAGLQRLLNLRQGLNQWQETQYVRNLDSQIADLLASVR
jgi:transcriptional regulator with XRE-family HTH domain